MLVAAMGGYPVPGSVMVYLREQRALERKHDGFHRTQAGGDQKPEPLPAVEGRGRRAGRHRPPRRPGGAEPLLQQLPGAGQPSRPEGSRPGGAGPLGLRLGSVASDLGKHDRPRGAGAAHRALQGNRGGAGVQQRLPGQRGHHRHAGGEGRRGPERRAEPCQRHRRLPALAGRGGGVPPLRRGPPGESAQGRPGRSAQAHRHGVHLQHGRGRRAAARDGGTGRAPRRHGDGGRGPRHRGAGAQRRRRGGGAGARRPGPGADGHPRESPGSLRRLRRRQRQAERAARQPRPQLHLHHVAAAGGAGHGRRRRGSGGKGARAAVRAAPEHRAAAERPRAARLHRGRQHPDHSRHGGRGAAVHAARGRLLDSGYYVQGIRPPTVPPGTSRLRVTTMATHTTEQMEQALDAFGHAR